jgi:hypothetical protein
MLRSFHFIALTILPFLLVGQDTFTSNANGRGPWHFAENWTRVGIADADGIPDSDDRVIISSGDTIDLERDEEVNTLTINSNAVLNHRTGNKITVNGNYTNNGIQQEGSGGSDLIFATDGIFIDGSGSISNAGEVIIAANLTIAATADLTIELGTEINFIGPHTVTNNGILDINDNFNGFAGCSWIQGTGSSIKFGHNSTPLNGAGSLDCSTNMNSFIYDKNNKHDSIAPVTYYHLTIDIANTTKVAHVKNDITVIGDLTINSGRLTTHSGKTLTVNGNTTLNTGGTLMFSDNTTPISNLQTVILNGGQLGRSENGTINCVSIISNVGTSSNLNRCNLNVSGSITVNGTLNSNSNNGVKTCAGDLTISETGNWTSTANESFSIGGNFLNNGTFSTGTGDYTFTGTTKSFNDPSGLLTFGDHITIDGTYTNNVNSLVVLGNLQGTGSLTNATNNTLTIGKNATISILNANAIPNTVIYNGTNTQGAAETDYYNLIIKNTGTSPNNIVKLAAGTTINVTNLISITDGTLEFSGVNQQMTGNANVTMAASTNFKIKTKNTVGTVPAFTGTYTLASGSTFTFFRAGNQNISNAFTYQNLALNGSGNKNLTGSLIIAGDLSINEAAVLHVTSTNHNITLGRNWISTSTNTDPFRQQNGTVLFNGTTTQTIHSTSTGGETFNNLVITKTSGKITLNDSVQINALLTLNQGIINSSTTALLTFNDGANSNGGDPDSFVDGPVKKIGDDPFTFPIGNGSTWARATISAPTLVTDGFTAQYVASGFGDASVTGALNNVSTFEYWTVNRAVTTTSNVSVKLYFQNITTSSINALTSDLVVARYNGTDWESEGQSAITATNSGDLTSNMITSFSPFTFGSLSSTSNPLPVGLINFEAIKKDNKIVLHWNTKSEINNDFFTIEKSVDGKIFNPINKIKGAGNSEKKIRYSSSDDFPFLGTSYYRLKQTDFNGETELLKYVTVTFEKSTLESYPNPIKNNFTIVIKNRTKNSSILITDLYGKIVYRKVNFPENKIPILSDHWASGIYLITLKNDFTTKTLKVIK